MTAATSPANATILYTASEIDTATIGRHDDTFAVLSDYSRLKGIEAIARRFYAPSQIAGLWPLQAANARLKQPPRPLLATPVHAVAPQQS